MKIVIIAKHIFPKQSPRSFRATELALELAGQGHDVTIYALLGKYNYKQNKKFENLKIKNLGNTFSGIEHSDGQYKRYSFFDKILYKVFGPLIEYPSIELAFKIPSILKKESNVDLLITIAHPHTIHWGAALSKYIDPKKFPKNWIADCGDPFVKNPIYKDKRFFYFTSIEKYWNKKADYIAVPIQSAIEAYFQEFKDKIVVIPQGFNFEHVNLFKGNISNPVPTFIFSGALYYPIRDPSNFISYLESLSVDFKLIIYTPDVDFFKRYNSILGKKITIYSSINRDQLLYELSKADFLINFRNQSTTQSPSKLIDYTLSGRPIISISSEFPDNEKEIFLEFLKGNYTNKDFKIQLSDYDIKNVAGKFLNLVKHENK